MGRPSIVCYLEDIYRDPCRVRDTPRIFTQRMPKSVYQSVGDTVGLATSPQGMALIPMEGGKGHEDGDEDLPR